jgi:Flavin reductase like domain
MEGCQDRGISALTCLDTLMCRYHGRSAAESKVLNGSRGVIGRSYAAYLISPTPKPAFFCKTETITHFGSHGVFIGRVEEVRFAEDAAPLIYQNGYYVTTSRLVDA